MSEGLGMVVEGLGELRAKLAEHAHKVREAQLRVLRKGAVMIHNTAVKSVQKGTKTGATYGNHRASAPGEAPATDTGNLASNIGFEVHEDEGYADIVSRAPYSMPLEFGTNDGKIAPRPFMTPAYAENIDEIKKMFTEAANG